MLTIYRKKEKTLENPSGIEEVQNIDSFEQPVLMCISAQDNFSKSIYGTIREGAQAARIHTTQERAGGFKIDEFPVAFLGIRFQKDENYTEAYEELTDQFVLPFLFHGKNQTVEELVYRARLLNFYTYCDGANTYRLMESDLYQKLLGLGLRDSEAKLVISQISLTAVATLVDTGDLISTTASFADVLDDEISTDYTENYLKIIEAAGRKSVYATTDNNNVVYFYVGTGNHSQKEYYSDTQVVKPAISSVLTMFLESSSQTKKTGQVVPISSEDILRQLDYYTNEEKTIPELLRYLDSKIFQGCPRYSVEESKMRHELDLAYKQAVREKRDQESTKNLLQSKDDQLNSLIRELKKYSSDTTYYQVLISAGLWQPTERQKTVLFEKSDREIREESEQRNIESLEDDKPYVI